MAVFPNEANSPLVVDTDRMLPAPVALPRFKPVAGRHAEIVESLGNVQQTQFAKRCILNICRKPPASSAGPDRRGQRLESRRSFQHYNG
jgi:hypothetical protein